MLHHSLGVPSVSLLRIGMILISSLLLAREPISPIPEEVEYDRHKALLGQMLFSDDILSQDYTVSCASCHDLNRGGADERSVSLGVDGQEGNIQAPTVFNARFNFRQFWDGRAADLHAQVKEPMHNPKEMNIDRDEIVERVNRNGIYRQRFRALYGGKSITYPQILDAIVEFEKSLVTPHSRFDRFLRGEMALTDLEARGYRSFKKFGCVTCHNGVNVGGNSYQRMGTIIPYRHDSRYPDLYHQQKKPYYKNVFKVPTLRNIALTAPYFHDASASTLEEAVRMMGYYNLGFIIPDEEIKAIVAFLHALTGDTPALLQNRSILVSSRGDRVPARREGTPGISR